MRPGSTDLPGAFDAVVLTGGRARRLGGADKAALVVGGRTLLDRVVSALDGASAANVIVVGPEIGGGPVAAIAAGLQRVAEDVVVILPGDLPFVTAEAIRTLLRGLDAAKDAAAAVAVDETGRDQLLCAAWRCAALRTALRQVGDPHGRPVRDLVAAAGNVVRTAQAAAVTTASGPSPWFDCDSATDLDRARRWAQDGGHGS